MPKKTIKGKIVSDRMDRTVMISVETRKKHKIYKKNIAMTKKFKARNDVEAKLGDTVLVEECTPFSKTVAWKVLEILEAGKK